MSHTATALYPGNPSEPATELSETLTQYTAFIILKFLTMAVG